MVRSAVATLVITLLLAFPASAQAFDLFDNAISKIASGIDFIWPDDLDAADFELRLGVGVGTTPDYIGSNEYRLRVVPLIDLRYKDLISLQGSRLRFNLIHNKFIKAGPILNLKFGREERRNAILQGLGDIQDTVQYGGFVEARTGGLLVSAEVLRAMGAGQGTAVNLIVAHGLYKSEKVLIIAGVQMKWASVTAMQTNFGITPEQSMASGILPVYTPSAGLSEVSLNIIGRRHVSNRVRLEGVAGYGRILGVAADSPLVATHGRARQFIIGIGTRYSF